MISHPLVSAGDWVQDSLQIAKFVGSQVPYIKWFHSVIQSCPTLQDPMDHGMPGLPVYHQLLKLTQPHVHPVGDAIQPSHPLSSPSPALNISQHQGIL